MQNMNAPFSKKKNSQMDVIIAFALVGILSLLILPLPTIMLDGLLAISITVAVIVLLSVLYMFSPVEFSVFPSLLLITTLFRLGLNVSSTRLILIHGSEGTGSAGKVIETFGQFVVGGNYVVGVVIFLVLVIINLTVIVKGSGRIAEVAARFTLDGLPGKQMSIDSDVQNGNITQEEANKTRDKLQREADFYGAMDGAAKFVAGDAKAGLIITAINIFGGIIIGVFQQGMELVDALETYTILTIGDGLVSQIPSLIISVASGMLVSRAASETNLGDELKEQLTKEYRALYVVTVILVGFSFIPGMPTFIFLVMAGAVGFMAYKSREEAMKTVETKEVGVDDTSEDESVGKTEQIEALLPVDLMELEIGYGLIPLVDKEQGGELLDRIVSIRRQFATDLGIIVPPIHIRDNLQLESGDYSLLIKGNTVTSSQLMMDRFLAMNPGDITEEIPGIQTTEPAFGMPAIWITEDVKERAESIGYTVVDCSTVIATHITEVIRSNAQELLGRQEAQQLLDVYSRENPKVVEELVPGLLSLGDVLKVLRNLLSERISIRDLRTILEALADYAATTKSPEILTELVRQRMSKHITSGLRTDDNKLYVLTLDRELEDAIRSSLVQREDEVQLAIDPTKAQNMLSSLEERLADFAVTGSQPLLLASPEIRRPIRKFLERFLPTLSIISHREVDQNIEVHAVGTVTS